MGYRSRITANTPYLLALLLLLAAGCNQSPKIIQRDGEAKAIDATQHYLISAEGDAIPTGVSIPIQGKWIDGDSIAPPDTIRVQRERRALPTTSNVHQAQAPTISRVSADPPTIIPGEGGVPRPKSIAVQPKVVPAKAPVPVPTGSLSQRESASLNIRYLSMEHGLASMYIRHILQDSHGNLWFAANGAGVYRYDGNSLFQYTTREGLIDNNIFFMLEDSRGSLWFASDGGGVCRYDGVNFYHLTTTEGLSHNHVTSIVEDPQQRLWFGTRFGGINCYQITEGEGSRDSITHYTAKEGLSSNRVYTLQEDSRGDLWIGTLGGGVSRFDPGASKTFRHYTSANGLPGNFISSIKEDDDGNLWFGLLGRGAARFDGRDFALFTTKQGLINNNVLYMEKDHLGRMWFATYPGGACRYNPGKDGDSGSFTYFTSDQGLSNDYTLSLHADRQGNMWIGTLIGGVNIYQDQGFRFFGEKDGLISEVVRSTLADSRGSLWISTFPGGLSQYRVDPAIEPHGRLYQHFQNEGLQIGPAFQMLEDSRANFWLRAINNRLWRCASSDLNDHKKAAVNFISYSSRTGLGGPPSWILEDSRKNMWIGLQRNGFTLYKPDAQQFYHFNREEGLISKQVSRILEDSKGNFWFGTAGYGLTYYMPDTTNAEKGELIYYSTKEGLLSNTEHPLLVDRRGFLWTTTDDGVVCYDVSNDGKKPNRIVPLVHYTTADGLAESGVVSALEDKQDNIWITTRKGITVLKPLPDTTAAASLPVYRLYTFNRATGLKQMGYIGNTVLLDHQNQLWWGSNEGLTRLQLDQFNFPSATPLVRLNNVEIEQTFVDYRRLADSSYRSGLPFGQELWRQFDSVPAFHNYPVNLRLSHHLNELSFQFSAIDWSAPDVLRYSYKMEGADKSWSSPSANTRANYSNLRPGRYTFKIKAIGAARIWSPVFEYEFEILPPWWLSWQAYVLYGILTLWLLYLLYRLLLNRQLTKAEFRRLRELDAVKAQLYTNITHEFRTPLTIILGMARQIRDDPKNWYREGLEMITRNGRQLLQLVNQMLDLSKLDNSKLIVNMQRGEIISFIHYLVQSFSALAAGKNIQVHFLKEIDQLQMDFDPDQLTKVIGNLLSNAVKYTPSNGQVYVTARSKEIDDHALFELRVKDTGPGISSEELPHIFDRFYQVNNSVTRNSGGSGLGLALSRELIQLMDGEIQVQSKIDEGTVFIILLPVTRCAPQIDHLPWDLPEGPSLQTPSLEAVAAPVPSLEPTEPSITKSPERDLPTALLVEDHVDVLTYLASCLEGNYLLEFATNGRVGIEQALELIPDIIISDVMMPEKSGYELCSILKEDIRTSHIPIILLTAKVDQKSKLEGLRVGADAYLPKPFDREELFLHIRKLTELRRQLQARFGELTPIPETGEKQVAMENRFLKRLRQTVEANLSNEQFGIAQLCREIGMSRSQLHNKLKALSGKSAAIFLRSLRLEKAKELLRTTNLNVSEVAYSVGFRTPVYFTQVFTETVGVSPSQYRDENS